MLAFARTGIDSWLPSRSGGLAPLPQHSSLFLASTKGLRKGRSVARAQVAREVQRSRSPHLGREIVRTRTSGKSAAVPHLLRGLGSCALSDQAPIIAESSRNVRGCSRVVPGTSDARCPVGVRGALANPVGCSAIV